MNIHEYEDLINPRKEDTLILSVSSIKERLNQFHERYRSTIFWFEGEVIKLKEHKHIKHYTVNGGWDFETVVVVFNDDSMERYTFRF